jgi:hypothetical protein
MKYVILSPKPGVRDLDRVIAFAAPTLHKEAADKWSETHQPVAAGFFRTVAIGGETRIETFGRSDSLQMGPRPVDAGLIASFERATNAMAPIERPAA